MSLLMDALRKAEADKKQEAAGEQGKSALTTEAEPNTQARDAPTVADDSDPSINVSFAETVDLGRATRTQPRPPPTPSAELTLEPLAFTDLMEDTGATDPGVPETPAVGTANATSTMPSMRGVEQQLDHYFDESQTGAKPPSDSDPLDELMSEPESSHDSGITETVASAYTVFEAGASGPSKRVIGWGIVSAGLVSALLLAAGFYYFQQAPTTQALPSPSVAIDVEKTPPKELPVLAVEREPEAVAPAQPVVRIEADPALAAAATGDPVADIDEPVSASDITSPLDLLAPPAADVVPPSQAPAQTATVVAPASGLHFGQVRIARSTAKADTEPLLNEAYAAYVAGDYDGAERAYVAVLERQPQRRDALLGLAALKLRNGEVAAAHTMYRDVLKRDPGNATAQAALYTLERGAADEMTESRLKLLLDQGVDSGYIYFSLGNLYARKGRWPDAQQAYFEALRYHPSNPDYNYNLAVALDRIGQRTAAAKYYATAVELVDTERAGFDPASALARLQALAGAAAN